MRQFEDLSLEETRHPLIRELEGDIARDKPFNIVVNG